MIAANALLMAKIPDPQIAHDADTGEILSYVSPESKELVDNFLLVAPMKASPAMAG